MRWGLPSLLFSQRPSTHSNIFELLVLHPFLALSIPAFSDGHCQSRPYEGAFFYLALLEGFLYY